jgi:polyhydroxyalkanoate synthesis regulator phasin
MNEPNEVLENTIAQLRHAVDIGVIVILTTEEAQAVLDELERRSGFERAFWTEIRNTEKMVLETDLTLDEQADLITELLEQLKQALVYWRPMLYPSNSQTIVNVRNMITKAENYLGYYMRHVKGVNNDANL